MKKVVLFVAVAAFAFSMTSCTKDYTCSCEVAGISTSVDVVDAEMFLANIKIQQQLAKFNYVIALNKLLSLSSQMSTFNQYETTAI